MRGLLLAWKHNKNKHIGGYIMENLEYVSEGNGVEPTAQGEGLLEKAVILCFKTGKCRLTSTTKPFVMLPLLRQ